MTNILLKNKLTLQTCYVQNRFKKKNYKPTS